MNGSFNENDIYVSHNTVINRRMFTGIHFHDDCEIYYLLNGNTTYFIGDEIFYIRPGSFVFIPKGVLHKTDSETCLNNERFLINIKTDVLDEEICEILTDMCKEKVVYIPKANAAEIRELTDKIENEYNRNGLMMPLMLKHLVSELFLMVYRTKTEYKPGLSEFEKTMQDVAEYISKHYSEEITLKSLATQFTMSESYLSRKFKSVCGIGICEYLTNVRITNSEKMLKSENVSVSDVAFRCGFNDSNYFSSVFRKATGISPLKYSKSHRVK